MVYTSTPATLIVKTVSDSTFPVEATAEQSSIYNESVAGGLYTVQDGTDAVAADGRRPTLWIEKNTEQDADGSATYDAGCLYATLEKNGGNAKGAAITGISYHLGGSEEVCGGHFRSRGTGSSGEIVGLWVYSDAYGSNIGTQIGLEINVRKVATSSLATWRESPFGVTGETVGLVVSKQDENNAGIKGQSAIYVSKESDSAGWWTGLHIHAEAISPVDGSGNGEAIRVDGADAAGDAFHGMRIGSPSYGHIEHAIYTAGATIQLDALGMAKGQKLGWGSTLTASGAVTLTSSASDILTLAGAAGVALPTGAIPEYADDAAAAAGGLAVGRVYRTGSALKIRVS